MLKMPGDAVEVANEAEMVALGTAWATSFPEHRVLFLAGEMGAGKTVFVKGLAEGVGLSRRVVQSPTFTLINEYRDAVGQVRLIHSDLYRLGPEEVEGTGLLDLLEWPPALCAVEWPDRLPVAMDAVTLRIIRASARSDARRVEWLGASAR